MLRLVAALVALLGSPAAMSIDDEPSDLERRIIDQAARCPNAKIVDPWLVWQLLEVEERAGLPVELRGLVAAAACTESGYNATARGDCVGRRCRAVGVLQLWPWWTRRYDVDREDPIPSAEAWLAHVVRQLPKAAKACPRAKGLRLWRVAQVRAVRAAGKKRCGERSLHWRRLARWSRAMGTL